MDENKEQLLNNNIEQCLYSTKESYDYVLNELKKSISYYTKGNNYLYININEKVYKLLSGDHIYAAFDYISELENNEKECIPLAARQYIHKYVKSNNEL